MGGVRAAKGEAQARLYIAASSQATTSAKKRAKSSWKKSMWGTERCR